MPQDESKPVDPSIEGAKQDAPGPDKGKQPAVETDDDDVDDLLDTDEAQATGGPADLSSAAKKKKSKRKKIKDALTGKSDACSDKKKSAVDALTPQQIAQFMSMNPALAQEIAAQKGGGSGPGGGSDHEKTVDMLKNLSLQDIMTGLAASGKNVKDMASYKFWQTQPVQSFEEAASHSPIKEGPIKVQNVEDVSQTPPQLLAGFEWVTMDLTDDVQMKEVYELLNGHYVEDDEAMFRFNYGTSILRWAMCSPGWKKEWHVGVRATQSKKLVAFISAIPMELRVRENVIHASEVNFLCIHKKLRSKRLAPVLIKEITRLCNLAGVWQAIYTGGIVLPTPVSTCRYFHRALNWQKLYDVGFSPLPANSKPQYQIRKYALPDHTSTNRLREMQPKDLPAVYELLNRYMKRWDLVPEWTLEEAEHWLLPRKDEDKVVWCYVVEDESRDITDFFSFYSLESTVINNAKHKVIRAAYLYYYATETGLATPLDKQGLKVRLNQLMHDALILAKRYQFDVFNALSMMDNALFLEQQKFGPGDGQLHFYLFNYRANPISGGVNKKNQLDENNLSGIGLPML
ncbi:Glycylpeptide N-tetradecanoyltransferase [Pleurostoma richardsiae]|uniref:Glycylpeptide N-tetradecanoyltransferase n=1 Tax=Pleurostoma richardsiae TaxID=41990 RepID=A0AA38VLH6_9PEZI|nr:Glycylpeptide N-tetradecanoyltransferase [Pleurostoma richardsiae]